MALLGVLVVVVGAAVFWYLPRPPARPPVEKASKDRMALPLPDKPSIAVMPFVNMTGDQSPGFLLRWVERKPDISPLQSAGAFRHVSGIPPSYTRVRQRSPSR